MREKILQKLAKIHAEHPWRMLLLVLLITIILGAFAGQMKIQMSVSELLPQKDPRVEVFNDIKDEFATATNLVVVIQGEEERIKAFADELAPKIRNLRDTTQNNEIRAKIDEITQKLKNYKNKGRTSSKIATLEKDIDSLKQRLNFQLFQRVDYKANLDFLRNHGLMLTKESDLISTREMFTNPNLTEFLTNLNDAMEKEYVYSEDPLSTWEKEENAVAFLDGIQNLVLTLEEATKGGVSQQEVARAVENLVVGDPYFISQDRSTLLMNAIPNFTMYERDYVQTGTELVQQEVDKLLQDYPDVKAGLSGGLAREHDEQVYAQKSFSYTTFIAMAAILVLLMVAFRMWVAPVMAIVNLFVGLIWALGVAYIIVGSLNMVTSMMSVIILGLGIDFSIHMISQFTEWRARGDDIINSLEKTFLKSGKGIITGAVTTACAFLALLISRSQGMREMGIVAGVGLLSVLLATFIFLPALFVLREKRLDKKIATKSKTRVQRDISFNFLGKLGDWLSNHHIFTIALSTVLSGLLIWSALNIKYDRNFLRMEPEGLKSIALMDTIQKKFDLSMEYALCLADSVEESRQLADEYEELGMVARVDDISSYLPSQEEQEKRIPHIKDIRDKITNASIESEISPEQIESIIGQIERLEMNVMEMQDMAFLGGQDKVDNKCKEIVGSPGQPDSKNIIQDLLILLKGDQSKVASGLSQFQRYFAPKYQSVVSKMCNTDKINLDDLPNSILDQYSNRSRNKFMLTIYPKGNLFEDTEMMNRFYDSVTRVSNKTTGTPILGVALIDIFAQDGRNAILLTLGIVFILLWIDFGKPYYALFAMIPLAMGLFWMVGILNLSGFMLTFMTFTGLPLIIGIGIDDGVHIMHRWQYEGHNRIHTVFSSTGKAILLTSLTTMLAFGSMMFSVFPAWAWFGRDLTIGVGACFVTTILILPGIFGLIEKLQSK